ncbi:MAG: RNA-binding protein, partial [Planctomycetes bacterium]|nr:RNA-binding protein [Planctomycetota bacterium]
MANKTLFKGTRGKLLRNSDTRNRAGGRAYAFDGKHALAQYVATGCLSNTFYADAGEQLGDVLAFAFKADAGFVAKAAVYAREQAHMKDTPALLAAVLATRDVALLRKVFMRVVDNGRMLRNFVQILRSGVTGRKSLGTAPKRLVLDWLAQRDDAQLLADSVGNDPSLADVIKMVHPKPADAARAALYAYLIGRDHDAALLPAVVRQYEAFKRGDTLDVPGVPFQLLTSLPLGPQDWVEIAKRAKWQMTRMNLNTFARHGVFERDWVARMV